MLISRKFAFQFYKMYLTQLFNLLFLLVRRVNFTFKTIYLPGRNGVLISRKFASQLYKKIYLQLL